MRVKKGTGEMVFSVEFNSEEEAILSQCMDEGFTHGEMAKQLGVKRSWINTYMKRENPEYRADYKNRADVLAGKPIPRTLESVGKIPVKVTIEKQESIPIRNDPAEFQPLNLTFFENEGCCAPTAEDGKGRVLYYCGHKKVGRGSYCDYHLSTLTTAVK